MSELIDYAMRVLPGLLLLTMLFILLPKKQLLLRIVVLILGFILLRDAMTPVGFWSFGVSLPAVWLRFTDDVLVLWMLGAMSLGAVGLLLASKDLRKLVRWGKARSPGAYIVGIVTGVLVALPFVATGLTVDISARGGSVAVALLPALLFMALAGNLLEELIFRGFYQSYLEKHMAGMRAVITSGLTFAAAHVFLASTVTDLGWPILVFVTIEGLACAFVYRHYGLIAAALTHGIAIFVLAGGWL